MAATVMTVKFGIFFFMSVVVYMDRKWTENHDL